MNILGAGMRCCQRLYGYIVFRVMDPSRSHHTIWSTAKMLCYHGRSQPDQDVLSFRTEQYAAMMSDNVEDLTELRLWSLQKIKENKAKVARSYNKMANTSRNIFRACGMATNKSR